VKRWLRRIGMGLGGAALAAAVFALWEGEPLKARTRPAWLTSELYPFEDRWLDIERFSGLMGRSVGSFFIRNYNVFVNLADRARDRALAQR